MSCSNGWQTKKNTPPQKKKLHLNIWKNLTPWLVEPKAHKYLFKLEHKSFLLMIYMYMCILGKISLSITDDSTSSGHRFYPSVRIPSECYMCSSNWHWQGDLNEMDHLVDKIRQCYRGNRVFLYTCPLSQFKSPGRTSLGFLW